MSDDDLIHQAYTLKDAGKTEQAIKLLEAHKPQLEQDLRYWVALAEFYRGHDSTKESHALGRIIKLAPGTPRANTAAQRMQTIRREEKELADWKLRHPQQSANASPLPEVTKSGQILSLPLLLALLLLGIVILVVVLTLRVRGATLGVQTRVVQASATLAPAASATFVVIDASPTSPPATTIAASELTPIRSTPTPIQVAMLEPNISRFPTLPIRVFLDSGSGTWQAALDHALNEFRPYVALEKVTQASQADIIIEIVDTAQEMGVASCTTVERNQGCARFVATLIDAGPPVQYSYSGHIWMVENTTNPAGLMLHELMHALGVQQHSTNPDDIMYPYDSAVIHLSPADIQLLRALYP